MERQALSYEVRNMIVDETTGTYEENYNDIAGHIRQFEREVQRKFNDNITKWEAQSKSVIVEINNFIQKYNDSNINRAKSQFLDDLENINKSLSSLFNKPKEIHRVLKQYNEELVDVCADSSDLRDFDITPDVDDILKRVKRLGSIQMNLPGVGPTQIPIAELEQRLKRRYNQTITDVINDEIKNLDISVYDKRTEQLIEQCKSGSNKINGFAKTVDDTYQKYVKNLTPLVLDVFSITGQSGVSGINVSPAISRFIDILNNIFKLEIEIELEPGDTSRDVLLAEIYQACDPHSTVSSEQLLGLAANLGLNTNNLARLSRDQLCSTILREYNL